MKLHEHRFGLHRIRCPFEDTETARELWKQFPTCALPQVFDVKKFDPDTVDIPEVNGLGFLFRSCTLTVFGCGKDVVFLDDEALKEAAQKVTTVKC